MNWVMIGKICTVLIAVLQVVVNLCNGGGFSLTSIGTIIAALVAAGFIHEGEHQIRVAALKQALAEKTAGK